MACGFGWDVAWSQPTGWVRPPEACGRQRGGALAVETNLSRRSYNTIRPHQALGDRTPKPAYLAGDVRAARLES